MDSESVKKHKREDSTSHRDEEEKYDVLYVYRPINIFNKLCGIQKITYGGKHITTVGYVAKIYSLLLSCFLITNAYFLTRDIYNRKIVTIVIVIDILSNISVCVSTVVSTLLAAFLISPFMLRALKSFNSIDEKLGIREKMQYVRIRKIIIIAQIVLITITMIHLTYELSIGVLLWSNTYRVITMHLTDFFDYCQLFDFTCVIWIIVIRLKIFNTQLEELITIDAEKERLQNVWEISSSNKINVEVVGDTNLRNRLYGQDKHDEKTRIEKLIKLMKVFDELADITNIVSSSYGLSILFSSTMTFLYIISTVNGLIMFKILLNEDPSHTIPFVIGWCLPDTIYLLIAAYSSEQLKSEVERTNTAIDKLSINSQHDTKECELIEDFSQLLSVREVYITAANFFPYDMTFILSLVGAVATYTVLLMQVKTDKIVASINSTFVNDTDTNLTLSNLTFSNFNSSN